jgi:hypothetical protein
MNSFDDIIRKVLGMPQPVPDESQPFRGSPLGPMIGNYLNQPAVNPPVSEGQMPPMTDADRQRAEMLGGSQQLPYLPGQGGINNSAPMIIPNNPADVLQRPNRPLNRGNAKYGSGIDI